MQKLKGLNLDTMKGLWKCAQLPNRNITMFAFRDLEKAKEINDYRGSVFFNTLHGA
jgi:hypothetical protein